MKISKKRSEPVRETQMVSLADIAFLIIFFFFLSSQFMKDRSQVKLPELPKSADTKSQISVTLAMKNNEPVITIDGDEVKDQNELESRLRDLLKDKKADDTEIRFRCEKTMPYKKYRLIYEAISNAGGVISIMHDLKH